METSRWTSDRQRQMVSASHLGVVVRRSGWFFGNIIGFMLNSSMLLTGKPAKLEPGGGVQ